MKKVFKYPLVAEPEAPFLLPGGAEILTVQMQNGLPWIWALVSPENTPEMRKFLVVGTGHEITQEKTKYIGTFQMHGGSLVFHVFEVIPPNTNTTTD